MIERAQIDAILSRLRRIESDLAQPETATDPRKLRDFHREYAFLTRLDKVAQAYFRLLDDLEGCRQLCDDPETDPDMQAMAGIETDALERERETAERNLRLALLPPDPDDNRNAVMEIRAGTGGTEAALFAAVLQRMYARYAERQNWQVNVVDASASEIGGYKEIVMTLTGKGAYGALRFESGGHRVQRVPVTESQGRIHTSAATVMVFPEAEPEDAIDLPSEELRVDLFCASGPGGQGVNTTYSAVRITHLPTGLVAQSQDERSQHRNKEKALTVLKARVLDQRRRAEAEAKGLTRRTLIGSGDRSQRIRTYNFPQNRLTDHRLNLTLYSLERIVEGELDPLLGALRAHDLEQRLGEELQQVVGS